jgi:hypothetical protein
MAHVVYGLRKKAAKTREKAWQAFSGYYTRRTAQQNDTLDVNVVERHGDFC